ncbi:MAG: hypothetical protein ACLP9C_12380 [Acidimicrobiales bacterium]
MLFVHEVHTVKGSCEAQFEAAFRDGWMPALARCDGARLLWYLNLAHGSGAAYTVVTVTAVADPGAWGALDERVRAGDLRDWLSEVDGLRHRSSAKVLVPVPWSPTREVDLASVPVSGDEHELTVYMEDTAWPYAGGLQAYLAAAGTLYGETLASSKRAGRSILEMEAAFQPAFGTARSTEVVLWQKVVNHDALLRLLTTETDPARKAPGTWMHDALAVRDRWESRLLRTSRWSPLF